MRRACVSAPRRLAEVGGAALSAEGARWAMAGRGARTQSASAVGTRAQQHQQPHRHGSRSR
eukprot:8444278-Alexandrium_andersonii.AAC.1